MTKSLTSRMKCLDCSIRWHGRTTQWLLAAATLMGMPQTAWSMLMPIPYLMLLSLQELSLLRWEIHGLRKATMVHGPIMTLDGPLLFSRKLVTQRLMMACFSFHLQTSWENPTSIEPPWQSTKISRPLRCTLSPRQSSNSILELRSHLARSSTSLLRPRAQDSRETAPEIEIESICSSSQEINMVEEAHLFLMLAFWWTVSSTGLLESQTTSLMQEPTPSWSPTLPEMSILWTINSPFTRRVAAKLISNTEDYSSIEAQASITKTLYMYEFYYHTCIWFKHHE